MKLIVFLLMLAGVLPAFAHENSCDVTAAKMLAQRVAPQFASRIIFEQLPDSTDMYELESLTDGRLVVRGNNSNSMAVGLNRYLTEWCRTTVSWFHYNKVCLPDTMPRVEEAVRSEAIVKDRFFLNYCTFGYTMPWWTWTEWERFIDWMALNGVNMPLAITGQEAVWQKLWREFGMSDEQIRDFFVGPAHLPWQRMGNIDRWQGSLPQNWIDSQAVLQKQILERERSLRMRPVLPAFAGHIPEEIAVSLAGAGAVDTTRVSQWGGFDDAYRCTFLSPMDSAFAKIQKRFLEIQTEMYGTDHIYGIDPFNEVDPPSWNPSALARYSSDIYRSLIAADPKAIWLQMGWLFYYDSADGHWTPDNIRAYLTAVPQGRMIILDYYCDYQPVWKTTDNFYGLPYIWCYLGNFGGNTMIEGDFAKSSAEIDEVLTHGGDNLAGIGSTLEGFGVNEPIYQFILDKAWSDGITYDKWIEIMADSRFGSESSSFRKAWKLLCDEIYTSCSATGHGTLTNARPCLPGNHYWTTQPDFCYDNSRLREVLRLMLQDKSERDAYLFDIVNVARQYMGNAFIAARDSYAKACESGDSGLAREKAVQMIDMLDDLDLLLAARREFSLSDWISSARALATTPGEADYYERNARTIITVWGNSDHLTDYANRNLSTLTSSYYKERWRLYLDRCQDGDEDIESMLRQFERQWIEPGRNKLQYTEEEDPVEMATIILDKW